MEPETDLTKFNLRLPADLKAGLEAHAKAQDMSLNKLVVKLLRKELTWLDRDHPFREPKVRHRAEAGTRLVAKAAAEKPFGKVGRNVTCPCGSQKKAKVCHPEWTR